MGLLDNSSLDEAPTLVMARKPLPFSTATDDRTIVDDVALAAPKPARAPSLPPRPATASKPPSPIASAPISQVKMKAPALPPRPTPSVPRPRSASTPPPLPASACAKPSRAPVPPLPAAAKRPLPPRSAAPVHAHG